MTEPTPYFDPFVPVDPADGGPPPPYMKVAWWDPIVSQGTPIMKYSLWPNWSRAHYSVDGQVIEPWWIITT
jgi:hypothetical protein